MLPNKWKVRFFTMHENPFLASVIQALENQQPTEEIMQKASGAGKPDLPSQTEAINDKSGNPPAPGDEHADPVGKPDPDRDPAATDTEAQKDSSLENADDVPAPGDKSGNPNPTGAPAAATESLNEGKDTLTDFGSEVGLHKNRNLIPLQQEKDAQDESGNTGDPAKTKRTPVSPSGDSKIIDVDKFVKDSYDKSGNAGSPGDNGTPVSKSGDSKELPKNEFEKAADDKDGNPDSPGVNGDPVDKTFEGFLTAIEQLIIEDDPGTLRIPMNMSLESYAMELGMGEIAAKAMEANLTAAERRALKDSDFGLPETRQWPLNDENHVRSAITNFHWCPQEKQRELAKNILKAMRKFGMKDVQISEGNPFAKYCPDAIVVPRKKASPKTDKE